MSRDMGHVQDVHAQDHPQPQARVVHWAMAFEVHPLTTERVDDVAVWSIICVVVRGGHRRRGITGPLLEGAVGYAASRGAPAVEAHPVDPPGRMDTTMAFVGTRAMFAHVGFGVVGKTAAVASRLPRLIMRRDLC